MEGTRASKHNPNRRERTAFSVGLGGGSPRKTSGCQDRHREEHRDSHIQRFLRVLTPRVLRGPAGAGGIAANASTALCGPQRPPPQDRELCKTHSSARIQPRSSSFVVTKTNSSGVPHWRN